MNKKLISMIAFMALVLTSCGGGGGGDSAPTGDSGGTTGAATTAATAVNMTVSGKSLDFTWTAGANVDHYRISVNPDGASGFTVDAAASNIASSATSHSIEVPVHKIDWLAAQYIVEACDAAEATCVASPNQTLALIDSVAATIYAKASNSGRNDFFGYSVSLSGDSNTLAVGAYGEGSVATGIDGNQLNNTAGTAGAVYVFSKTGNTWAQQAYVKASNTGANDQFGFSVSLSNDGNTLAVGANKEDSSATGIDGFQGAAGSAHQSGAVYVFSRTGTTWSQQAYVKASNTNGYTLGGLVDTKPGDNFGVSVSLSGDGNTLAVGATGEQSNAIGIGGNQADNTALNSGAVYVFARTGTVWAQQAYVKASNTNAADSFGSAVSLSSAGNTLAVSASGESSNATGIDGNQADNSTFSGAVYVFSRTGSTWIQQAYVKSSNSAPGDGFGGNISLSGDGNTLAVGAGGEDSNGTGINGAQADNTAGNSGAVYVFSRTGATWTQQAYVKASNTELGDSFGSAVSLSSDGNTLAVGTILEDSNATGINGAQADNTAVNSGAVYVFSRTGTTWSQEAYVKASNTDVNNRFGQALSLSSDGDALAIGAYQEDGTASGIGGDQTATLPFITNLGAVYLY